MAFQKGNTLAKGKGKPKGSKHQKTLEWEEFGKQLLSGGIERANQIMADSKDQQFMDYFFEMLKYFKPQLSRTTVQGDNTAPVKIIIEEV